MGFIGLFLMIILNAFICYSNCQYLGQCWAEAKMRGGWPYLLVWSVAICTAAGLSWCYLAPACMLASTLHILSPAYVTGMANLGYLLLAIPMVAAGFIVWLDSLATFWRQQDLLSGAVATWNTYAELHNMYCLAESCPSIFQDLGSLFTNNDSDNASLAIMIVLVVAVLGAGIYTTIKLVQSSAQTHGKNVLTEIDKFK